MFIDFVSQRYIGKRRAAETQAIIRVHSEIRLSNWLSFCPATFWLEPQRLKTCGSTVDRAQDLFTSLGKISFSLFFLSAALILNLNRVGRC